MNIIRGYHFRALLFMIVIVVKSDGLHGQMMLGDDQVKVDILRPSIETNISLQPTRSFRDDQGSFSVRSVGAAASVPIYDTENNERNEDGHSRILLHGQASVIQPEISILSEQHTLYTGAIGMTYGTITASRNEYILTLNAGIAEDQVTVHDARARIMGFGLGTSQLTDDNILMYGLAYTYAFDRGRLVPVLGLRWRFAEQWVLQVMLPFSLHVKYHYAKDVAFGFGINVHGNRFRFSDGQLPGGQSEVANLRLAEIEFGAHVDWKLNKDLLLKVETGISAARNIYITSGTGDLLSARIRPTVFLGVNLRYLLGDNASPFEDD
jgi:hypothetical protein